MARRKIVARRKNAERERHDFLIGPYLEMWMSLTPAERQRRAWRLRSRLENIQAIHDAKTLPKL